MGKKIMIMITPTADPRLDQLAKATIIVRKANELEEATISLCPDNHHRTVALTFLYKCIENAKASI